MPLTFAETPLYYKDAQGNYHRILSGADMTGYRTASAQDVIDAAQDADIASRAKTDEIGIVITGSRPSMAASPGQYVIVRGSTITDITDGLYKAVNALSPSTDVTAADLTAVSGGGLNDLKSSIGVGKTLYSCNINNVVENGVYAMNATQTYQNSPSTYGTLIVTGGSSYHNQMAQVLLTSGKVYIRYCSNRAQHTWLAWYAYNGTAS